MSREKYEELDSRVGNSEPRFCGRSKEQTQHILIRETENEPGFLGSTTYYNFKLKCRKCGNTDLIYRY